MAHIHNAPEEQMHPSHSSPTLSQSENIGPTMPTPLNLENAGFVGKTLVGHPADGGRPCTLGTIMSITDYSQSTVIRLEKKGNQSGISLERATWACEGDAVLVDCAPPSLEGEPQRKKYVRYTTKPSMPAVQAS